MKFCFMVFFMSHGDDELVNLASKGVHYSTQPWIAKQAFSNLLIFQASF